MSKIFAGLDLPTTKIASLVLVSGNSWKGYFWLPEKRLPKFNLFLRHKYSKWIAEGHIRLTRGDVIDHETILQDILKINSENPFAETAFDPYQSTGFINNLQKFGMQVVEMRQTFITFSPLCQQYICSKPNFNNPVLCWMDSNLSFLSDSSGNQKPNKKKGEIGGIVAGLMAMGRSCALTQRVPDAGDSAQ